MALSTDAKTRLIDALADKVTGTEVGAAIDSGTGVNMTALAALTNGNGASLVGIEDAATIYTATTVEAALAEVKVEADAAMPTATLALTTAGNGASKVGIQDALGVVTATTVEGAIAEIAGSRFRVQSTISVAESNAGKTLLADVLVPTGAKVYIEGIQLSVGSATAWSATASSTKLTFSDTAGTALVDAKLAGLGSSALLLETDTTNLVLKAASMNGGSTANKGISVRSDGTHDVVAGGTIAVAIWGRLL